MKTTVADWATFPRHAPRAVLLAVAVFGLATTCSVATASASAQESASQLGYEAGHLWSPVAEDTLGAPDRTRRIEGREHRVLRLDRGRLADVLARAPLEQDARISNSQVVMELPWPDGNLKPFRIAQASITEPGLKARCPDVKTYRGRGTGDTWAYAQVEWSPSGFRALISADNEQVYIAPYAPPDMHHYIVYYARDWRPPGGEPTKEAPATGGFAPGPSPVVSASAGPPSGASIEAITIRRLCRGCENQYQLTLQRDGTATMTRIGVLGLDHKCTGSFAPMAFTKLAALMQRAGFFDLDETYRSRYVDGQSVITSAIVAGRRKAVENSNQAGPSQLKVVEDAIDGLGEKVTWTRTRP